MQEHKSFAAEIEQQQKVGGDTVGSAVCVYTSSSKMGGNVEVKLCSSNDLNDAGKCCQGLHLFLVAQQIYEKPKQRTKIKEFLIMHTDHVACQSSL